MLAQLFQGPEWWSSQQQQALFESKELNLDLKVHSLRATHLSHKPDGGINYLQILAKTIFHLLERLHCQVFQRVPDKEEAKKPSYPESRNM